MQFLKSHWRETLVLFLCLITVLNVYFTFRVASHVVAVENGAREAFKVHENILKQIIQQMQGSPM